MDENIKGDALTPEKKEEDKTSENEKVTTTEEENQDGKELDSKTLLAQKVHYREKVEKVEKENTELQAKLDKLSETHSPVKDAVKQQTDPDDSNLWKDKVDFLLTHRDYTKDEVEFLSSVARGTGKSLQSLTEDKDIKSFLDLKRKRVEEEQKSLNPSSRTSDASLHEEIAKIPEKEMAKHYPELLQKITARNRSKTTV